MLLSCRTFFVKERVSMLKLTDTYDIFDPTSNEQIGIACDEPASWAKFLRLVVNKRFLPTEINIYEDEESGPVFTLAKKPGLFRVSVVVKDASGNQFGSLRSKIFSLGGGFTVLDNHGNQLADVKGDWKGWNFRLLAMDGMEIGVVTKKWSGFGKEFFTSADNYMIALHEDTKYVEDPATACLLLAAGLAIDIVFKEKA